MTTKELRRVRKELGLTQRELAAAVGVHLVTVARWETGTRRIPETAAKLVRLLAQGRRRPR